MSLPEGSYADVGDGLRLHYHALGSGPPVLFLHGSGPGASGFSNFHAPAATIAEAGFTCVLADTLGYGHSSKPDVDYGMEVVAGASMRLMNALGHERFSVLGNSHGGAQAMWITLQVPERVDRLVLMAPGGLEERETYMEMRGIRSMLRCIYGPEGITLDGMMRVFQKQLYDPADIDPELVRARFELAMTQSTRTFRTLAVPNLADRLPELRCPVLGLWGANDLFCPPSGALRLAQGCPDVRVVVYGRCGHWVMVERQEEFVRECLAFLG